MNLNSSKCQKNFLKKISNDTLFHWRHADRFRLQRAFQDIVRMTALKQVPTAESHEFVQTNVIGAQNVIEAAIEKSQKSNALSTDRQLQN